MAHVHTNREDRIKDMADELRVIHPRRSMFIDEVGDLEPEKTNMPSFDNWCKMSQAEKDLYRDLNRELNHNEK